jgi:hypothetical protein
MAHGKLKPIRVFYSELTGRFYAARAWKVVECTDDKQRIEVTGEKFDVTDDIGAAVTKYDVVFTAIGKQEVA